MPRPKLFVEKTESSDLCVGKINNRLRYYSIKCVKNHRLRSDFILILFKKEEY